MNHVPGKQTGLMLNFHHNLLYFSIKIIIVHASFTHKYDLRVFGWYIHPKTSELKRKQIIEVQLSVFSFAKKILEIRRILIFAFTQSAIAQVAQFIVFKAPRSAAIQTHDIKMYQNFRVSTIIFRRQKRCEAQ